MVGRVRWQRCPHSRRRRERRRIPGCRGFHPLSGSSAKFDSTTGMVLWKLPISGVGGPRVRSERHPVHRLNRGLVELSGQSEERRDPLPRATVCLLVAA